MAHVANVVVDHTKVPSDLTDFVIYINLAHLPASFWDVVANGGGDIRVFKSDGTTELAREVVSCDTATDTGNLYLKYSGTLSSSVSTTIQIHADGTSSDYASSATYGRNNVWTNYNLVLHLLSGPTDSSGTHSPSTVGSLSYNGTTGAQFTNSTSDYINVPHNAALSYTSTMFMSLIGYTAQSDRDSLISKGAPWTGGTGYWLHTDNGGAVTSNRPATSFANTTFATSQTLTTSARHMAFTKNGGSGMSWFLQGAHINTVTTNATANYTTNTTAVYIGRRNDSADMWNGPMREVRLSATVFSDDWIEADYNNLMSASTFYTASPAVVDLIATLPATEITNNSAKLRGEVLALP